MGYWKWQNIIVWTGFMLMNTVNQQADYINIGVVNGDTFPWDIRLPPKPVQNHPLCKVTGNINIRPTLHCVLTVFSPARVKQIQYINLEHWITCVLALPAQVEEKYSSPSLDQPRCLSAFNTGNSTLGWQSRNVTTRVLQYYVIVPTTYNIHVDMHFFHLISR